MPDPIVCSYVACALTWFLVVLLAIRVWNKHRAVEQRRIDLEYEEEELQESWAQVASLGELGVQACERGRSLLMERSVQRKSALHLN